MRKYYQFNGAAKMFTTQAERFQVLQRVLFALKGVSNFDHFFEWDIQFTSDGIRLSFIQEGYKAEWHRESNKTRNVIDKVSRVLITRKAWIRSASLMVHNDLNEDHDRFEFSLTFLRH